MEASSGEKTNSNTTVLSQVQQAELFSSDSHSETLIANLSIESHNTTYSQDQYIENLCKEIEAKNSRIEEVEGKYNQTCGSLNKLVSSLCEEIEHQKVKLEELEEERKKNTARESASRLIVSLMREIDCKNEQIRELKRTCNEIYSDNRKLVQQRDFWHKIFIQEEMRMQNISRINKKLKSDLKSMEKELVQLVQGVDEPQSGQQQSCLMQVASSTNDEISALKKELEEKTEEVLYLQNLNQTLILKECASNNELLDAQRELLNGLHSVLSNRTMLGIKRMGELDTKPFRDACLAKFPKEEREIKCAETCSLWENHLKDSNWHPFKIDTIDGNLQEIIDESDEKLEELRKEWGEEVYKAVANALLELNEYNPSGRFPVPKIWNFREGRKVNLKEVIGYIIQQLKTHKRKR